MQQPTPAQLFLLEADDLLAGIEEITLELQDGAAAGDRVHQLFRAFHTIKGSGAMFGFDQVAEFTHHVETTLDAVRSGSLPPTAELASLLLMAKDHIKLLLSAGQSGDPAVIDAGRKLIDDFHALGTAVDSESEALPDTA